MTFELADGYVAYASAFAGGIRPDPPLWVDSWAEEYMRIPRENGAEPGKYRVERTPFAREPMQCLSPEHPCRRVVVMAGSQLMKTQVGLNWIGASVHQAPGNILLLLPTIALSRRVSSRIAKTFSEVDVLREIVAKPRDRDSRNTIDTKEFRGGTLYIATARSASNLAEIPARYVYGDEVDRWEGDVDGEGDPIELGETRTSTFGRKAKIYYTSSPTIEGASRIAELFRLSDQREYFVPCPHCGHMQQLVFEHLRFDVGTETARYVCQCCGVLIDEHHKSSMLAAGEWRPQASGDGETIGFHLSALYSPLGWVPWKSLCKQHAKALNALERGDSEPMQVFYNTRLARTWDSAQERMKADDLKARAERYALRTIPDLVTDITAAVDVQSNRLELLIVGWAEGLERWVLDYQVLLGDPSDARVWNDLDELLRTPLRNAAGKDLLIRACAVDSGGHHTQEVYDFCRHRRHRNVLAIKGESRPNRPIIPQQPRLIDFTPRGKTEKWGVQLWFIGTDSAKEWLMSRMKIVDGPGALHMSDQLQDEFFSGLVSERKIIKWVKGRQRVIWEGTKGERNEVLDMSVYCLAMAYYCQLHKRPPREWERARDRLNPRNQELFKAEVSPQPENALKGTPRGLTRPRGMLRNWVQRK